MLAAAYDTGLRWPLFTQKFKREKSYQASRWQGQDSNVGQVASLTEWPTYLLSRALRNKTLVTAIHQYITGCYVQGSG